MARIEPDSETSQIVNIDLVATVRGSLVQLTPWILNKGHELTFDVDDKTIYARVDPGAINIALNNLVTNAANFSPPNGMITYGCRLRAITMR